MTGLFACACDAVRLPKGSVAGRKIERCGRLCGDRRALLTGAVRERRLDGAVLVGCPLLFRAGTVASIADEVGLASSRLLPVAVRRKGRLEETKQSIRRAVEALAAMQPIETRPMRLEQRVLVVGEGRAALDAADAVARLGHPVTTAPRLTGLRGFPGGFEAEAATEEGPLSCRCGAVVVATMPRARPPGPGASDSTVAMGGLLEHLASLRRRQLPRSLVILLDVGDDEGVTAHERAFRASLGVRRRYPTIAVTVAMRDAKVSRLALERLYGEVREAGAAVIKHAGSAVVAPDAAGGVVVRLRDELLGAEVAMRFDLAAASDLETAGDADRALAAALGLGTDARGQVQEDNIRLLPGLTNRPGIFAVGACRGESWEASIARDAADAAAAVHELLAAGHATVELGHAVVDADKCALCLTCIRTCPAKAMRIMAEEQRADCTPELCRRCGICVGECPNRAITLPAWSERVVMALAGASGAGASGAGARG